MTSFRFTILALSAAALSVSASAPAAADGGRSVKDHQSDRPFLWSGAYAGFHVGGRWGDYRVAGNGEAFDLNDREANKVFSLNPDNLIGGVQVGYGVQAGRFVLGVEADVSFGNARDEFFGTEFPDDQFARVRLGTQGALTARLGLPFGQVMPYIKGGLALTRISVSAGDVDDNKPVPESSTTESLRARPRKARRLQAKPSAAAWSMPSTVIGRLGPSTFSRTIVLSPPRTRVAACTNMTSTRTACGSA